MSPLRRMSNNNNKPKKISKRPNKLNAMLGWIESSSNIRYRYAVQYPIPRPSKVLRNLTLGGSTGVISTTASNTSAGVQILSAAQINNFTTRFAGFREYLLKGVTVIVRPVSQVGSAAGTVAFWIDEVSSITPTSTALDNINHASVPVIQENATILELRWVAHDIGDLAWLPLATSAEANPAYLKWYGDGGNTALAAANGVQLFMVDYYFLVDFRGYA